MRSIFLRFKEVSGIRHFVFDCIMDEKQPAVRTLVSVDLALARKHGISIQALPLVCRQLIESKTLITAEDRHVSLTEQSILKIARDDAASGASNRRKRRPPANGVIARASLLAAVHG